MLFIWLHFNHSSVGKNTCYHSNRHIAFYLRLFCTTTLETQPWTHTDVTSVNVSQFRRRTESPFIFAVYVNLPICPAHFSHPLLNVNMKRTIVCNLRAYFLLCQKSRHHVCIMPVAWVPYFSPHLIITRDIVIRDGESPLGPLISALLEQHSAFSYISLTHLQSNDGESPFEEAILGNDSDSLGKGSVCSRRKFLLHSLSPGVSVAALWEVGNL